MNELTRHVNWIHVKNEGRNNDDDDDDKAEDEEDEEEDLDEAEDDENGVNGWSEICLCLSGLDR